MDFTIFNWKAILEICIIFVLIYIILRFIKGTRGVGILRGLLFFLLAAFILLGIVVEILKLPTIEFLLTQLLAGFFVMIIIIFQPELRRGLIHLGQNPLFKAFLRGEKKLINEIAKAVSTLSKNRIGALIAIQREVGLATIVEGGVKLDADVSSELINTIFWPGSPLHDGAIVIDHLRVAAAGCLFPLSENPDLNKELGTRHRAGVGVTEESDAICIIVSEQTGRISVAMGGKLEEDLTTDELKDKLGEVYIGAEIERAPAPK